MLKGLVAPMNPASEKGTWSRDLWCAIFLEIFRGFECMLAGSIDQSSEQGMYASVAVLWKEKRSSIPRGSSTRIIANALAR